MAVASALSGPPCCPLVHQNTGCSVLKDEDVLVVEHQRPWPGSDAATSPLCGLARGSSGDASDAPSLARCSACGGAADQYSLFAVFDGHNGASAARQAAKEVVPVLEERLPQGAPPSPHSPQFTPWREDIQLALVETLAELNRLFAMRGILAGCTATLVLQVGWLVTAANLGDSRAIIDTGVELHHLTVDHRVATHKGERRRVEAMGNTIAPIDFSGSGPATRVDNGVGPLRIWPGGLCLSRAIGDFDVGDSVIPFPHVMQVTVPPTGARLLIASDGVWDAYEKMGRVGSMLRSWSLDVCPQRLIQSIVRAYGGLRDDTSLVVVDILPPGKTFPECAASVAAAAKAASGGSGHGGGAAGAAAGAMCGCFGSAPSAPPAPIAAVAAAEEPAAAVPPAAVGRLEVLADLDVAAVMGLMPETESTTPGWYDEYVGEALFSLASEAMELWHEAHERRTGRRPATPQLDSSVRAARAARALLEGDVQPLIDASDAAWAPAPASSGLGGGMRRNASMFFPQAVADGDYADKFGHYKGAAPASLASGSPGSSLHGPGDSQHGTSSPGGSGHRAGGYKYNDASVRAGNRYNDASVRAGSRYLGGVGDVSVRAGSRYGGEAPVRGAGDVSVRAGSSFYSGGGGSGGQQGPAAPPFRPDPSIRSGTAALRYLSDSAGSAGSGDLAPLAAAAAADEGGEGRRHGIRSATLAAALASGRSTGGSGGAAAASASASAPIPVPRSVTFGGVVKVMDAAAPAAPDRAVGDSPMERSAALQPAPAAAAGHMDSIAEA